MTTKIKFKLPALESATHSASIFVKAGKIHQKKITEYDDMAFIDCVPIYYSNLEIKQLRTSNHVSQSVFARYLNVSKSTVEKWESGARRPNGPSLKILSIIEKYGISIVTDV